MSKPKDTEIEKVLRRLVKAALKKKEEVKVNDIRALAESELGLEERFLKDSPQWRSRSKAIILETFNEDDEADQPTTATAVTQETNPTAAETPKRSAEQIKQKPTPQQRSSKSPTKSSGSTSANIKAAAPAPAKLPESLAVKSPESKVKPVQRKDVPNQESQSTPASQHQNPKTPRSQPKVAVSQANNVAVAPPAKLPDTTWDDSTDESSGDSTTSSEEEEEDDDDDDDDDNEDDEGEEEGSEESGSQASTEDATSPKKPEGTVQTVNGVKRKAAESIESDATTSDGDSNEDSATDDEHKAKKVKVDSTREASVDTSEEESNNEPDNSQEGDEEADDDEVVDDSANGEDGEDETGGSESDEEEAVTQQQDSQTQQEDTEPSQRTFEPVPAKPFKPPLGYTAQSAEQLQSNTAFTTSSLEGKQIWHIIAPSNLPLSSLTEISLDAIRSGNPLMTHNNTTYVVHEDSNKPNDKVYIMVPSSNGYKPLEQKVQRTLQIQQKITLPNLSVRQANDLTGSIAAADVAQPATTSIRPQVKGLRMRYKPPGFGRGRPGMIGSGSDSADEDEGEVEPAPKKATFQFPKALGAHGISVEETAGGAATNADVEMTTPKKAKKKRKDEDKEASQSTLNGTPASPEVSAVSSVKKSEDTHGTALPNGASPEVESKEEKAKRKEEKGLRREKKEAKRKARETSQSLL